MNDPHLPCCRINHPPIKFLFEGGNIPAMIYRAPTRLRSLFKFKDFIPSYLTSGIIYKYTCCRCNSTYVGESIHHAKRRYSEHLGISALSGKPLKGQNSTAVRDHILSCKPEASFKDFKIIGRDTTNKYNLRGE